MSFSLKILPLAALFFAIRPAAAAEINAASCAYSDVQSAIASAASGDIVKIPAGTCTWTSELPVTKAITLQGAGIGSTILLDGVQNGNLLSLTLVANQTSRVTAIEFREGGRAAMFTGATIAVSGSDADGRRVRIDHCRFDHPKSYPGISAFRAYGVVDHNEFLYTPTNRALNVHYGNANDVPAADNVWAAPADFGTGKFLFIEDNTFTYDPGTFYAHIDCFDGGRWVARYNTVTRGWFECHGTDSTGRTRGGRAVEVYHNTFQSTPGLGSTVTNARSGTWLVYDNTISGYDATQLVLKAYRNVASQQPFGGADGTNNWDKNVPGGPFLSGTASGGGTWAVTVAGAGWAVNQWAGYSIRKTSGGIGCTSVTRDSSIQPTVTAVCNGHGLAVNDFATVRGANQPQYNHQVRVSQVVDPNTFRFLLYWGAAPATPATGTITVRKGDDYAHIVSNTSDTLHYAPGAWGAVYDLAFTAGDTFQLWRVQEAIDQPCNGQGSNIGGAFNPVRPAGWNNQIAEGCYEWNNVKEGGADVDFLNAYPLQVVEGQHVFNDTPRPGYIPYTYPHPLVSGAPIDTTLPSPPSGLRRQ